MKVLYVKTYLFESFLAPENVPFVLSTCLFLEQVCKIQYSCTIFI